MFRNGSFDILNSKLNDRQLKVTIRMLAEEVDRFNVDITAEKMVLPRSIFLLFYLTKNKIKHYFLTSQKPPFTLYLKGIINIILANIFIFL